MWVDGKHIDFGDEGDYTPPTPEQEAAFKDLRQGQPDFNAEGWTRTNDILAGQYRRRRAASASRTSRSTATCTTPATIRRATTPRPISSTSSRGITSVLAITAPQSDSRKWGLVPERLMLGKAVFIFFPIPRIGFIK